MVTHSRGRTKAEWHSLPRSSDAQSGCSAFRTVDVNICRELRQLVYLRLLLAPVVAILPARDKPLYVCERRSVVPPSFIKFVRKPRQLEALLEVIEGCCRDIHPEWLRAVVGHDVEIKLYDDRPVLYGASDEAHEHAPLHSSKVNSSR